MLIKILLIAILSAPAMVMAKPVSDREKQWYPVKDRQVGSFESLGLQSLLLDAPAGKHGYPMVKSGDIYFENNQRVRFWGINIAMAYSFPGHKEAESIARDLASQGINIVRFHHLDYGFPPMGLFKDTQPGFKNIDRKKTGIFDEQQLDKLDYFIYQLKLNGIYSNLNILSGRKFTEADGVKDAAGLREFSNQAGKPVSIIEPVLIDLQEKYIRQLLSHVNPYTKLAYKDDPAIAQLELSNENSLIKYWVAGKLDGSFLNKKKELPDYYKQVIDKHWRQWQREQGRDPDDTRPAWKTRKLSSEDDINNVIQFYMHLEEQYFSRLTRLIKEDIGSKALITASGHYFSLANLKAQSVADFTSPHYYWDEIKWTSGRWNKEKFQITNASVFQAGRKDIEGMARKNNPIADMSMSHLADAPLIVTEWNQVFPNQYGYEMPLLLSTYGSLQSWDGAMVFAYRFGPKADEIKNTVNHFFEIASNPQKMIVNTLAAIMYLGEHIEAANETIVIPADNAEIFRNVRSWGTTRRPNPNWGLSEKSYLRKKVVIDFDADNKQYKKQKDNGLDPVKSDTGELAWYASDEHMVINSPFSKGAMGFVGNKTNTSLDDIGLTSKDNGVIMLSSLDGQPLAESGKMLLVCVGQVTNTNARWSNTVQKWGKAPVLMQRLRATMKLPASASYDYTPIDLYGAPMADKSSVSEFVSCPENAPWALLEERE